MSTICVLKSNTVGCLDFSAMIPIQNIHKWNIYGRDVCRRLQPTIIRLTASSCRARKQNNVCSRFCWEASIALTFQRQETLPSDNIRGITVAIPTNISGEATSVPAGPVFVPHEMIRGESHGARVIILTESSWRNTRRWHFRSLGYELQPPMHTHILKLV